MTNLTAEQALAVVRDSLGAVAPDIADELQTIDLTLDLWEELQLDSMDHLNVMTEIFERTGCEIPERDYGRLRSLDAIAGEIVRLSKA